MIKRALHMIARAGLPAFALVFQTGCSVFQSSRAIDMTPFAENTAMMFGEAAKVSRVFRFDNLRPYAGTPELLEMRAKAQPLIRGLRAVVMYSNQLVALNMSSKSDAQKNRLLAAYFKEAAAKVANPAVYDSIGVSPSSLDTMFANIEKAPTFREGVEAASPLVNGVVLALNRRLDEIDEGVPVVIAAIDRAVESDYAAKRKNYSELVRLQTEALSAVPLLYDARRGDRAALAKLLEVDPSMREFITSPDKPTPSSLKAAEDALTLRLERIDAFLHQLDAEKAVYTAKLQELESLRSATDDKVKVARDAIMIWAQSHRNLGAGIAVPPLIDVASMAGGLARKVVPLP
jgi:hypothetical protein